MNILSLKIFACSPGHRVAAMLVLEKGKKKTKKTRNAVRCTNDNVNNCIFKITHNTQIAHDFARVPPAPLVIFKHENLTHVDFSFTKKEPHLSLTTFRDLRDSLMDELLGLAFDFRLDTLIKSEATSLITDVSWDYTPVPSDQCVKNTLSVTADPADWQAALALFVREIQRLALHGLGQQEFQELLNMFLQVRLQELDAADSTPSADWVAELMECVVLGDVFMSPAQRYECYLQLARTLTLAEVNERAAVVFCPVTQALSAAPSCTMFISVPMSVTDCTEELVGDIVKKNLEIVEVMSDPFFSKKKPLFVSSVCVCVCRWVRRNV